MKVSELEGAELDYWVGMALGYEADGLPVNGYRPWFSIPYEPGDYGYSYFEWSPSTNWAQAGPIIEQYL